MKTRIPSTVVTSIFVFINFIVTVYILLPMDFASLISESSGALQGSENMGMIAMMPLLLVGGMILFFLGWMLAVAITHAILLVFTVKNRKSSLKTVRIINCALDAANIFLIVAPIVKFITCIL